MGFTDDLSSIDRHIQGAQERLEKLLERNDYNEEVLSRNLSDLKLMLSSVKYEIDVIWEKDKEDQDNFRKELMEQDNES